MSYFRQRVQSFACAINGVAYLLTTQAHAGLHLLASFVVVALGVFLNVSLNEWAMLAVVMCVVWVAEAINTAIELTVDLTSPGYHPLAGNAKDVAAGAVLIASVFALVVGLIVFGSKFV